MSPPALAYVVRSFPSLSETFVMREIDALLDRGWDIRIFCLDAAAPALVHAQSERLRTRVIRPPRPAAPALFAGLVRACAAAPRGTAALLAQACRTGEPGIRPTLGRLRRALLALRFAALARRYGIRHVHAHFAFVTADVAALMARQLGTAYSVSAHAWDIYCTGPEALARRLLPAAFVVTCSEYNRAQLAARVPDLPPGRLHVCHHGVDPARFDPAHPADGHEILAAGRFEEKKGFGVLIDACRLLREAGTRFTCSIAGDGPLRASLAARIAAHGLSGQVRLPGALTQEQMRARLRDAALVCVPSVPGPADDRDALPNVILEAMASGLPVVASGFAAIPEAVRHEQTGLLVPPGDAAALAHAIGLLLGQPAMRAAFGQAARETARERFDIARQVLPLDALFRQATGRQP